MNGLMFVNANANSAGFTATPGSTYAPIALPYYSGYVPIGAKWIVSNGATYLTTPIFISGQGGTIYPVFPAFGISVAVSGSSLPGIVFNPKNASSCYEVQATVLTYHTGGTAIAIGLYETNSGYGPFGVMQIPNPSNAAESQSVTVSGVIANQAVTQYNIQVQMSVAGTGATAYIGDNQNRGLVSPIQWTVTQIA